HREILITQSQELLRVGLARHGPQTCAGAAAQDDGQEVQGCQRSSHGEVATPSAREIVVVRLRDASAFASGKVSRQFRHRTSRSMRVLTMPVRSALTGNTMQASSGIKA